MTNPIDPVAAELDVFEFFGPPIHVYTRAEALADGVLVDGGPEIQQMVREAGFTWPLAFTIEAWEAAVAWDPENGGWQDVKGRLWDVLSVLRYAIKALGAGDSGDIDRVNFHVLRVPNKPNQQRATACRLVCGVGGGDNHEPVLTIMLPSES